MQYLAGSLFTLVTMYIVVRLVNHPKNNIKPIKTVFNQSRQFELVRDYLPMTVNKLVSQASKHFQSRLTRIIFINNKAYWIENGSVHQADFVDGNIQYESKIKVDTMAMDDVELDKMIFIVERLTEGLTDDSGNSGN